MRLEADEIDAVAAAVVEKLRAIEEKPAKRLLTVDDAATYLGRTAHSIRHMVKQGRLPTVPLDNRIFLDIRDLDSLIESKKAVAR